MSLDQNFWSGKKVLVTGHTGFKGAWLSYWLHRMGAKVSGIALPPQTEPNLYKLLNLDHMIDSKFIDIRNQHELAAAMEASNADIVIHLAAQALVRESYKNPVATFETNFAGTCNVLEGLRQCQATKVAVIITTDKVYKNLEREAPFVESDELGGHDPYSASKAAAELLTESYRESFLRAQGLAVATARAGNVIGGGDWSAERLIPDCVKAWAAGETVEIRMPHAVRPWQHVLDPLAGYMILAQKLWQEPGLAGSYNFGPDAEGSATVGEAVSLAQAKWGAADAKVNLLNTNTGPKESRVLRLNNVKARSTLGVKPVWALEAAMDHTVHWYRDLNATNAQALCNSDIESYEHGLQ